jgi:glucose-6-phosphate isomerase
MAAPSNDAWENARRHAEAIKSTHLRELLRDDERNAGLYFEACGFSLDASRQNATLETKEILLDLARSTSVESKKV